MSDTPTSTFVATLSDGTTATRSPSNRIYAYAVEATRRNGHVRAASWHSTLTLANDKAEARRSVGYELNVRVIPVVELPYDSDLAIVARTLTASRAQVARGVVQ